MPQSIYFLPGHGGRISNGLGQELVRRGFNVLGRETVGDFKKLGFDVQVATVAADLKTSFWREDARACTVLQGEFSRCIGRLEGELLKTR